MCYTLWDRQSRARKEGTESNLMTKDKAGKAEPSAETVAAAKLAEEKTPAGIPASVKKLFAGRKAKQEEPVS